MPHLCTRLKFIRHMLSFARLKSTRTSQVNKSFVQLEGLQIYLNNGHGNQFLLGNFAKFSLKPSFFEMLMDRCSKNSNKLFSRTTMNASEWMKKNQREKSDCSIAILVPNN